MGGSSFGIADADGTCCGGHLLLGNREHVGREVAAFPAGQGTP